MTHIQSIHLSSENTKPVNLNRLPQSAQLYVEMLRQGYTAVGELKNVTAAGHSEILLRKSAARRL